MQLEAINLGFRYDENAPWILRNINISIKKGERVGLTGPSGYGKSTLAKLLAGYEEPVEGKILCKGDAFLPELAKYLLGVHPACFLNKASLN
jgi:peptide/nickel transport system ATP-binding protein